MKDHIHTIPVLDALREPGHCPFCKMYHDLEQKAVDFIMGPAYMDEAIRDKTNETGFCADHLNKMYAVQNRLGIALLLHTHLKQVQSDLQKIDASKETSTGGFFRKVETKGAQIAEHIATLQKRCYVCERIQGTFSEYMETFFYIWPREEEIKELVHNLHGFCIPHYGMMISAAEKSLNKKSLEEFLAIVIPVQLRALKVIEYDMDWFVQKFDYRNADEPWKNSKDAINRAMAMLKGIIVE